ncbi:MAG TPA: hypothetical protein VIU33_09215, partial [Nitrospiria bacterium]
YDEQSELAKRVAQAYRSVLPDAQFINFDHINPDEILTTFDTLSPKDLVVLIQSESFRLSQFRIRIELFNRKLKVIEHPHLGRMKPEEYQTYFDSLAYDPDYYRTMGPKLKERIARAKGIKLIHGKSELVYEGPFEDVKLNIGDYRQMKNTGGQFPIGEIFTEPKDVTRVNGEVSLFAFGDTDFSVNIPEKPFTARIEGGLITGCPDAPLTFHAVLDEIRQQEGKVWVRELGFGLNRAFSRERTVTDIGTYERMCGIHLSLGTKHLQYKKPGFPKRQGFHVDVFVDTERVEIDGAAVYREGKYQ